MSEMEDLLAIQARDPDDGEVQPTDAAHAAHKAWAVGRFGEETWREYRTENWAMRGLDVV